MTKLQLNKIKKSFSLSSHKLDILKSISFEIKQGETVALLGKSGSGKSTLLSLIAGLDQPDEGSILIDGQNIVSMSEKKLAQFRARNIGVVFQQFHLVSTLTALENVLLPLELSKNEHSYQRALELLTAVGLKERIQHLPSELSGGECQRVAIARALAVYPSVLLADEPSGNLDEETGEKVMDYLFKMAGDSQATLLLVTHDQELARKCSRIIHLEHGGITCS